MNIGDIVSNGINYWMVWYKGGKKKCECCGEGGDYDIKVVPVSFDEKNNVITQINFNYRGEFWFNKSLYSIKPFYRIVARIDLIPTGN